MPSERRLHPSSVLFSAGSNFKQLIGPLAGPTILVLVSAPSEWGWEVVAMILLIPFALVSLVRCLTYRYRLEADELVVRTGVIFRSVRHVPYGRIQNIDLVQNVLHRLFGVAEVRIETGGAGTEASMQVISLDAFEELRRHVEQRRAATLPMQADAEQGAVAAEEAPGRVLLALSSRDLMVSGFIHNRGAIVIGAGLGLLLEAGLLDRAIEDLSGGAITGSRIAEQLLTMLSGRGLPSLRTIVIGAGGLVALLLAIRVLSMAWALVALHRYTLVLTGEDLRATFGLFTRVTATIPIRRIQRLTIIEGPLHRRCGRVSVRVVTAGGGEASVAEQPRREWLAPILRKGELDAFLADVLPGVETLTIEWQAPHPRAFRRTLLRSLVFSTALTVVFSLMLRWWSFALFAALTGWSVLHARRVVAHLRWGVSGTAIALRRGWLGRHETIARLSKIQAVGLHESPFDRRHGMARVHADTAGGTAHAVQIPYMPRDAAVGLWEALAAHAARTAFKW